MKVLLVEPKYGYSEALTWIPIGKGYLATQARNLGMVKYFHIILMTIHINTLFIFQKD